MALRGTPTDVFSDPGPQIEGANNVMQKMISNLDEAQLKEFAIQEKLKWHFTAADGHWQNGCSESLRPVKLDGKIFSLKFHLNF